MDVLVAALVDGTTGPATSSAIERLLQLPGGANDVLVAMERFVASLFRPERAATTAGFGALLAAILSYRWWKYAWLGLFTRIVRPRVLDQATRARIFQFIESNPGTRAQRIVKGLGLAPGQAMHHLYVLERQGLVTRTRGPLSKRYFVRGQYSPDDMHALLVQQSPSLAGLETAVRQRPGATIKELAEELRLSSARVSRMSQQLSQAGVLDRVPEGRLVRLFPKAR